MDAPIQTRTPSIWWSSGYGVMTRWSRDQIPGSTEAFLMGVEIIEPRVLTFRRSLKKHRWSKALRYSVFRNHILVFRHKPQQLLLCSF